MEERGVVPRLPPRVHAPDVRRRVRRHRRRELKPHRGRRPGIAGKIETGDHCPHGRRAALAPARHRHRRRSRRLLPSLDARQSPSRRPDSCSPTAGNSRSHMALRYRRWSVLMCLLGRAKSVPQAQRVQGKGRSEPKIRGCSVTGAPSPICIWRDWFMAWGCETMASHSTRRSSITGTGRPALAVTWCRPFPNM